MLTLAYVAWASCISWQNQTYCIGHKRHAFHVYSTPGMMVMMDVMRNFKSVRHDCNAYHANIQTCQACVRLVMQNFKYLRHEGHGYHAYSSLSALTVIQIMHIFQLATHERHEYHARIQNCQAQDHNPDEQTTISCPFPCTWQCPRSCSWVLVRLPLSLTMSMPLSSNRSVTISMLMIPSGILQASSPWPTPSHRSPYSLYCTVFIVQFVLYIQ
jgi:hypothetical protein